MVGPIARRAAVGWLIDAHQTSLRRACRLVGLSTATWRYQRRGRVDNVALLERLQAHAAIRARYGYRRLHTLVAREGIVANHKRVHRVYREAGLQVRRRRRKRLTRADRVPLPAPSSRGERWSMDFMADTLADGRAFRTLNIVDDFSRECVAIEVDRSLPGARVVRVLDHLRLTIGLPKAIVLDNGPEFAGRALEAWAYAHGVELRFIRPGKPIENAYVESFNGKFRDECLNEHWFVSLADAKGIIEAWRVDYNTVRPHGSLGQLTPAAYAAAACADPKPGCGVCSAAALATTDQRQNPDGLSLSV
jgi:putative transposase